MAEIVTFLTMPTIRGVKYVRVKMITENSKTVIECPFPVSQDAEEIADWLNETAAYLRITHSRLKGDK